MKRNRKWKVFLGVCLSLVLLGSLAAPQVLAYEDDEDEDYVYAYQDEDDDYVYDDDEDDDTDEDADEVDEDDPYAYVPINLNPTDGTAVGTVDELTDSSSEADSSEADSSDVVGEYNLASENWDELLGVPGATTSEEADDGLTVSDESEILGGWMFAGNNSSDGGLSRIFIAAIIAFAAGAVGITFFVYSQFIYKAKLRRKAAESGAFDYDEAEDPDEGLDPEEEAPLRQERQPSPESPVPGASRQSPDETHPSSLSQEDQERLNQVDWDSFFGDDS